MSTLSPEPTHSDRNCVPDLAESLAKAHKQFADMLPAELEALIDEDIVATRSKIPAPSTASELGGDVTSSMTEGERRRALRHAALDELSRLDQELGLE